MYAIAIVGDLLSLIPFVNIITDVVTAALLKIAASPEEDIFAHDTGMTLFMLVVEFIPGLAMFPTFTLRVWWAKRRAKKLSESSSSVR